MPIGSASTSPPYGTTLATGAYPSGQHVLRARATDSTGSMSDWSSALVQFAGGVTQPSGFTRDERWVTGLTNATAFAQAPDGRLFVAEQGGTLRVIKNGTLLPTPFATFPVDAAGERGLIGVALHPDFVHNGFVYVYSTRKVGNVSHNRISRLTANGDVAAASPELVIADLPSLSSATNHNGGGMHFGADGKLYVGVGENANPPQAQDLSVPFGKLLRFNDDGSIPADNPFFATQSGFGQAVWAYGLRNPYTFSFQPGTGLLYINDVGQNTWEEIDVGTAGANYGWPNSEGPDNLSSGITGPLFTYKHSDPAARLRTRADSSRASRSPAARSIRRPGRSPRAIATSTTSPTTSASSSAASIRATATPPTRSPACRARRSICWWAPTARSTC